MFDSNPWPTVIVLQFNVYMHQVGMYIMYCDISIVVDINEQSTGHIKSLFLLGGTYSLSNMNKRNKTIYKVGDIRKPSHWQRERLLRFGCCCNIIILRYIMGMCPKRTTQRHGTTAHNDGDEDDEDGRGRLMMAAQKSISGAWSEYKNHLIKYSV